MMRMGMGQRYGSVPPGLGSRTGRMSVSSSIIPRGHKPSYACAPSKYFSTTPSTVTESSVSAVYTRPVNSVMSTKYFDPTYPSRQFGSRLSKGYSGIHTRPSLHDVSYGESVLAGAGRDSWSAYRQSDAAMDAADDIATYSRRRDYEVIKGVEQMMPQLPPTRRLQKKLNALSLLARHGNAFGPPVLNSNSARCLRASSVPPQMTSVSSSEYRPRSYAVSVAGSIQGDADWPAPRVIRNVMPSKEAALIRARANASLQAQAAAQRPVVRATSVPPQMTHSRVSVKSRPIVQQRVAVHGSRPRGPAARRVAAAHSMDNLYYSVPPPKVQVQFETVPAGRDLLTAKEKLLSREVIDLESPSGTLALKLRLADAHNLLDKHGAMIGKYSKGTDDKVLAEVDSEVRRIKHSQAMRAKSVM